MQRIAVLVHYHRNKDINERACKSRTDDISIKMLGIITDDLLAHKYILAQAGLYELSVALEFELAIFDAALIKDAFCDNARV